MRLLRIFIRVILLVALNLAVAYAFAAPRNSASPATASEAAPRVQGPVAANARVVLHGNTHPLIQSAASQARMDLGAVEDSLPAGRMLLLLQRSPEQEAALTDFIQAAHTPGSSSFHQWLKPQEFGRLYGPADSDVAAVTAWLESHGLTVNQVHTGRLAIEFSGTAGQVGEAFQTQIHRYQVNGEMHLANAADPSVPAALAPAIAGLAPLNDFHPQPRLQVMGRAQFNPKTHQTTPQWTYPQGGGVVFVMAPGDFAKQYDINSVYSAGTNGTGQSIAIISESNVDLSLVSAYLSLFSLAGKLPTVVVDGVDPGQNGAAIEAYLDIEIAGSVAPGATVLLYTSGGTALSSGLALAAMRAVEDDQAGVISVSYSECESVLGQGGNAFWSALWQQAAAQGQTVFVSSGDGGSAGCDNFDTQQAAYGGLAVNGIASTPYNVAVGGTDFFYSSYNTPSAVSAELNTYWTTTSTTTPTVSLLQPIPEQAWNDFFGFNMYDRGNPANQPSELIVAGGGGASSAALYPSGIATGYAKPAWQTGTGVPADHVRDLPDLSLFAANGYNYSFYPICASPGDCSGANLTSSGTVVITGVGGTSAGSPAMAGIQSLINQSTGVWAGQANFIYYPLATSHRAAFHDVTIGGNQVLCYPGTANCVPGSSATNSSGFYVENGYSAGTGYDLATGLGSVDVANLIANWNLVPITPTTSTLNVSPVSLVHGNTAAVYGAVTRSSGSGTPTGSVSLNGNNGISHYASIDDIALSAGNYYASVDNLPGGTYQLTAVYGGDGTFGASKSAPVTVTVTPENNTLTTTGWAWNPYDLYLYPLSAGITLPYGAQIFLDAQPTSANATIANEPTPATGTVTFTDKLGTATVTATQPLNTAGVAEWSTGVFAPGNHTVSESYSGDPSYNPSAALSAASITVIQGSTSLTVKPLVSSVAAGASVTVDVILTTGYLSLYGTLPTGNVTATLGTQSISAPWQPYGATGNASLEAVVTFSSVPAGILPLIAYYQGDNNWLGSAANGGTVISLASKFTPTVVLTTSLATPAPNQTFTLTATVTGVSGKPNPTGTVAFLSDGQSFSALVYLNSGTASLAIPGYAAANGTNIFTAVYQGDGNYNAAASNAVNVTISQADFSLTTQIAELSISPSGSATSTLALAPINGFSGTVSIFTSAPAGVTGTPAAVSLPLSAPATDVLTLNVAASTASGIYPLLITAVGGGHIHTAQILVRVLAVAAPVFSPAPGSYATAQQVTLANATGGGINSTTNGTTPTGAIADIIIGYPILPTFINNTCMADQQTGADMGAKITACNTALASTGGIIDATNFQGTQYASVGFTVGPALPTSYTTQPAYGATLKLGYVTLIAGDEIKLSPFSHIIGQAYDLWGSGVGATNIVGNHNKLAVIDMTGCTQCTVEKVNIETNNPQTNSIPKTGISISRNPAAGCVSGGYNNCLAGSNTISNVSVEGYFQNAAFYAVESELLTLEHFYGVVYDSTYYPGGVKPKYCMAISQTDVIGLGLYNKTTMAMGSVENSSCFYYPTRVNGGAAIYFGGGDKTVDWSFSNVYLLMASAPTGTPGPTNENAYIEIQTSENNEGNFDGPLIFDNVDGENTVYGNSNNPTYGYYIHGPGANPAVSNLSIHGSSIMSSTVGFINATVTLYDADIESEDNMLPGQTVTFNTVFNSTIKLPNENTTIVNAINSNLEGGAGINCSTCGMTVSGGNNSVISPAPNASSTSSSYYSPILVNPTFIGSMKASGSGAAVGYATGSGAGCAVTQGANRTTGVTCNANTGQITLDSAAGSTSYRTFTVTDSSIASTDTVSMSIIGATNTYNILTPVVAIGGGSFTLTFNAVSGTSTDAPVFNFTVMKGSSN